MLIKTARDEMSPKVRMSKPLLFSQIQPHLMHRYCASNLRVCNLLLSAKVSAVSAVVNWGTGPKAFVFRNYNHKPGSLSRYAGGSNCQMWQAVRASSAAPGYFQEFLLQSDIHQVAISH